MTMGTSVLALVPGLFPHGPSFLRALLQQSPALGWTRHALQVLGDEGEKGTAVPQQTNPSQALDKEEQVGTVAGSMTAYVRQFLRQALQNPVLELAFRITLGVAPSTLCHARLP